MIDKEDLPKLSNHFNIYSSNGQEFIIEFAYQEPPPTPTQTGEVNIFVRVALSRLGIQQLSTLFQTTLNRFGGQPPIPPRDTPRF